MTREWFERSEYKNEPLEVSHLDTDPMREFEKWFDQAVAAQVDEPSAFVLATVGGDGSPASRTVLLKGLSAEGLVFYTNYQSRKGAELAADPRASAVFLWLPLHRQVRIEGVVEAVDAATSDHYFASRPYESQLASAASPQSRVVPDRAYLERLMAEVKVRHPNSVPRPPEWGGYCLAPRYYEFWQGREARLHDRFRYQITESGWQIDRLAP
ncbi:MAG: pyridoxamine 5'-phosphate oxidase [bacterium]